MYKVVLFLAIGVCGILAVPVDQSTEVGLPADTPEDQINFFKYRLHEGLKRYLKVGQKDGCNENMRFFALPGDDKKGACDCDWYQCSRPLLYHSESDKCYWAWSTGPCPAGEWFVFDVNYHPKCEKFACSDHNITETDEGLSFAFQNPKDSKCYEAGTKGDCKEDEVLMIYPGSPIPHCRSSTVCNALSFPPSVSFEIKGSKYYNGTETITN